MLGTMQDKQKKYNGKKPGLGILIIVIIMVLGYVFDSGSEAGLAILLPFLIIAGAYLIVYVFTKMLMKTRSGTTAKTYAKPTAVRKTGREPSERFTGTNAKPFAVRKNSEALPSRYTETEEAIRCTHSRGKQKYLDQIDSFLANGIIDKAEYRLLKERYEKLDLPDDFH